MSQAEVKPGLNSKLVSWFFLALVIFFFVYLKNALSSLAISFLMAYLSFPIVRFFEKRGLNRLWALIIGTILLALLSSLIFYFTFPLLITEARKFVADSPIYIEKALNVVVLKLASFGVILPFSTSQELYEYGRLQFKELILDNLPSAGNYLMSGFQGVRGAFVFILNLLLIPVFFVFLILDFEKVIDFCKGLTPAENRRDFAKVLLLADQLFSRYIRGQFLVGLCLSVFYSVALSIVGLPFGFLVGCLGGLMCVIPYLGIATTFLVSSVLFLADPSLGLGIGLAVVFSLGQVLEGFFITPRFVGSKLGLTPFSTMLALIFGANVAGVLGMFLSLPLVSLAYQLAKKDR